MATTDASGAQLHLYPPATVRTGTAQLRVRTQCPWDGRVEISVEGAPAEWTLALRVPRWCTAFRATVNGDPVAAEVE